MAGRQESIEDHVTCSICIDLYDDPLALPCMHSFCRKCLEGLAVSNFCLKCPECRADIQLGHGGVSELPKNFQLGRIVESFKLGHPSISNSTKHSDRSARRPFCTQHKMTCQLSCKPCRKHVCLKCVTDNHDRHKFTADNIADDDEEFEVVVCKRHTKNYKLYCKDCNTLVCLECIVTTHNGHLLASLKDIYEFNMCQMQESLTDLEARQRLLRATQKSCRTLAQKAQMDSQTKRQELASYFARIRTALDKREALLKSEISDTEKKSTERYLQAMEMAKNKENAICEAMDDIQRLLGENRVQFLQGVKDRGIRASKLLENEEDDGTPRMRSVDDAKLVTCPFEKEFSNIQWSWRKEDIKPTRKAPPAPPADRKQRAPQVRRTMSASQPLGIGDPVQRGKDWKDGMEDGGPGHFGKIVQVMLDPNTYMVRWPNGNTGNYVYNPPYQLEISTP